MCDGERVHAMHMKLELFTIEETCNGEEEIAGNAPVDRAVSSGKERRAAVRNRVTQWRGRDSRQCTTV